MFDRIKRLCLAKKITIAKLERDLGFANGSIAKSDEKIQATRLHAIANYFGVSMEYLLYGKTRESSIMPLIEIIAKMGYEIYDLENPDIYYDRWGHSGDIEPQIGDERSFEICVRTKLQEAPEYVTCYSSEQFYKLYESVQDFLSAKLNNSKIIDTSFKQDLYDAYISSKYKNIIDQLLTMENPLFGNENS